MRPPDNLALVMSWAQLNADHSDEQSWGLRARDQSQGRYVTSVLSLRFPTHGGRGLALLIQALRCNKSVSEHRLRPGGLPTGVQRQVGSQG